jgi:hypothetical protein
MNAQDINQTFDLPGLVLQQVPLKKAGSYYIGPCPMCGGRDRFVLKSTPNGWRWFCRQCGDGKYHTPIDFVMKYDSLTFREALSRMGGISNMFISHPLNQPEKPLIELPSQDWKDQAKLAVFDDTTRLFTSQDAQPTRDYLRRRGLELIPTCSYWSLGYESVYDSQTKRRRPAISIPYLDGALDLTAIKYRFTDKLAEDKRYRYTMRKGSKPLLFGLYDFCGPGAWHENLLLVEGEINVLSIWQVRPKGFLTLSLGSDTITDQQREVLRVLLPPFKRVVFWFDNPDKAIGLANELCPIALPIRSPELNGKKYDANAILQLQPGELKAFLDNVLADSQTF